jgi:hypothetical protein
MEGRSGVIQRPSGTLVRSHEPVAQGIVDTATGSLDPFLG